MSTHSAGAFGTGYALAYREARSGLEDQERSVVELRARAGTLIAAAAITTYLEPTDGEPLALHLIERDLALHMGRSAELNRRQLKTVMAAFRFGALLLILEVMAWVAALITQG
jgi:hypothetical protein